MNTILIPNELKDDEGYLLSVCSQMVMDSLVGDHSQFHKDLAKVQYLISVFAGYPEKDNIEPVKEVLDEFDIDYEMKPMQTIEQVIDSTVETLESMEPGTITLDKSEEGAKTDISDLKVLSTMARHYNCIDTVGSNMSEILVTLRNGIRQVLWQSVYNAVEGVEDDMALGIERDVSNGKDTYSLIYQKDTKGMTLQDLIS